jgi:hypothetical protein
MTWGFPLMRCNCGAVGKPVLTPGDSRYTWRASCAACHTFIKVLPRLGEPAPGADEASRGPQLYATTDLARAALQELARRQLRAMGIDPEAPGPGKHEDG